jgi:hypothetical protein
VPGKKVAARPVGVSHDCYRGLEQALAENGPVIHHCKMRPGRIRLRMDYTHLQLRADSKALRDETSRSQSRSRYVY